MWTWVLEVEAPCLVGLLRRRRLAVSQPTRAAVQAAAGVASANHSDMLPSARLVTRNTSPHRSSFDRRQTTDGWSRTLPLPGSNTLVNVPLALATGGKHNSCVNRPAGAARACDHHVRGSFHLPSSSFTLARISHAPIENLRTCDVAAALTTARAAASAGRPAARSVGADRPVGGVLRGACTHTTTNRSKTRAETKGEEEDCAEHAARSVATGSGLGRGLVIISYKLVNYMCNAKLINFGNPAD